MNYCTVYLMIGFACITLLSGLFINYRGKYYDVKGHIRRTYYLKLDRCMADIFRILLIEIKGVRKYIKIDDEEYAQLQNAATSVFYNTSIVVGVLEDGRRALQHAETIRRLLRLKHVPDNHRLMDVIGDILSYKKVISNQRRMVDVIAGADETFEQKYQEVLDIIEKLFTSGNCDKEE